MFNTKILQPPSFPFLHVSNFFFHHQNQCMLFLRSKPRPFSPTNKPNCIMQHVEERYNKGEKTTCRETKMMDNKTIF